MFTEWKKLFDGITKSSSTREQRLMIGEAKIRDVCGSFEIDRIRLIRVS